MNITTIGLDLAKRVFHVVCCDKNGKEVQKKMLKRSQLLTFFTKTPPCRVCMEACASSHYWGRELKKMGHDPFLISPQHVKPYVRGNKNDYNDARAIAEAGSRADMPRVAIKTPEQQDMQALHRMRTRAVRSRTALCNSIRGLLGEYGIVLNTGIATLRRGIPMLLEDAENNLSLNFRILLSRNYEQLRELDDHIDFFTKELELLSRQDETCQRLQTIPGFGPIVATAFQCGIGNGDAFHCGRNVAASLGLVPRQHSSGGKDVLLGISKRGDRYLRGLLIHGARAVVSQAQNKTDPLCRWVNRIRERRGFNKAVVALANKLARIGWAVIHTKSSYQSAYAAQR